jgi:glutaconate CoA-transferase subunit B
MATDFTRAELCICTAAEAWRNDGEVLASGITVIPRLAASLAASTFNPDLLLTDGEAMIVSEPVPVGPRDHYQPKIEAWMPYRVSFELLWGGKRHIMGAPTQIDRFGATNISCIGDHKKPKSQLLGARGFPGNSVHHKQSMWVPAHDKRCFVEKVDMASSASNDPARWKPGAKRDFMDFRLVVTNLCVLDFGGPGGTLRLVQLHPGVSEQEVRDNTGFDLARAATLRTTPEPTPEQLHLIRDVLDPHNLRAAALAG